MVRAATLPALLVQHDEFADRVAQRARAVLAAGGLSLTTVDLTVPDTLDGQSVHRDVNWRALLEPALMDAGADAPFPVVHVVGPILDPSFESPQDVGAHVAGLISSIEGLDRQFRSAYPGKRRIDHWVVHSVGQIIDPVEWDFMTRVASAEIRGFRALVVSASATMGSMIFDVEGKAALAANLSVLLVASDLEQQIRDTRVPLWACGSSSVRYAPDEASARSQAIRMQSLLRDHWLAPLPAEDPSFGLGHQWVDSREFLADSDASRILTLGGGTSLRQRVSLTTIDWDSIPVTSWESTLATAQTVAVMTESDDIEAAVDRAVQDRLVELKRDLVQAVVARVTLTRSIETASAFLEGVRANLKPLGDLITTPSSTVDPAAIAADRAKLRRMVRWLPFGPAVALRAFGFSLGVLLLAGALFGSSAPQLLSWMDEPWGRLSGVVSLLVLYVLYQRRVAALLRVRNRLATAMSRQLADRIEFAVAEARRRIIAEFTAWVGSRPVWPDGETPDPPQHAPDLFAWFAWVTEEFRTALNLVDELAVEVDVDETGSGQTSSTRFALTLPETRVGRTRDRAPEDLRSFGDSMLGNAQLGLAKRLAVDLSLEQVHGMHEEWLQWVPISDVVDVPEDLGTYLSNSRQAALAARRVLESDTSPVISEEYLGSKQRLVHYLFVDGGRDSPTYTALFGDTGGDAPADSAVSVKLEDVVDSRIPGFAAMIHLHDLRVSDLQAPAGETPDGPPADETGL